MIRKVMAGKDLLRAAGTVTKKLASWLAAHGYVTAEDAEDARERGAEAARDLPRADELTELLHWAREDAPPERVLEEWEDVYPVISRVEPGKLWFQGLGDDREIGPVAVPAKASDLAREEWAVSALCSAGPAAAGRSSNWETCIPSSPSSPARRGLDAKENATRR